VICFQKPSTGIFVKVKEANVAYSTYVYDGSVIDFTLYYSFWPMLHAMLDLLAWYVISYSAV
jgi:hypothetical protein